jgi:hypothetical protein
VPTKTFRGRFGYRAPPFEPSETELFSMEVCARMAQALDRNAIDDIKKLYGILNDASSCSGSIVHIAAYVDKHGTSAGNQRSALRQLAKAAKSYLDLLDALDWQSNELIAAGYAKDENVYTATADSISSLYYSKRESDLESTRRLAAAITYAEANIDTSSKVKLGLPTRYAKHLVNSYEEFTGCVVSGERSDNKQKEKVKRFLELGLNYITQGELFPSERRSALRRAAEARRKQG